MKTNTLALLFCFLVFPVLAEQNVKAEAPKDDRVLIFNKGEGAKYRMTSQGGNLAELSITISDSTMDRLGVEYFMSSGDALAPVKLWQQYILERPKGKPIKIVEGYIFSPELSAPEKLEEAYLKGYDGVQMNDFLFSERAEIDKDKIGDETIEVPAGNSLCSHYRKAQNGQTVDFWISKDAGAIGLVKLVSKSEKKSDQNYSVELLSLLKNVAPTINPKKAVPLTEKGKSMLPKPMNK